MYIEIPQKTLVDFIFNVSLCLLLLYVFTGVAVIPFILIIYLISISAFYTFSFIVFYTRLECNVMMEKYNEIEQEVKMEKEQA